MSAVMTVCAIAADGSRDNSADKNDVDRLRETVRFTSAAIQKGAMACGVRGYVNAVDTTLSLTQVGRASLKKPRPS